jgi:hypothetical protein
MSCLNDRLQLVRFIRKKCHWPGSLTVVGSESTGGNLISFIARSAYHPTTKLLQEFLEGQRMLHFLDWPDANNDFGFPAQDRVG